MGRFHHVVRCFALAVGLFVMSPLHAQPGLPGLPGGGSSTIIGPLEMSCDGVDAIACKSVGRLEYVGVCDDSDGDGVCNSDDRCADTPAGTPVFLDGCHLSAEQPAILSGVRFEFDSARLRPESRSVLDQALAVLKEQSDVYVSIDGHTDAKGGEAYNQRLSYARARSVFDYFRQAGMDTDRLVYRGFGESRPIEPNQLADGSDNPAGRAVNRRVELTVVDAIEFESIRSENRSRASAPDRYSSAPLPIEKEADVAEAEAETPVQQDAVVSEEPAVDDEQSPGEAEPPVASEEPSAASEEPSAASEKLSAENSEPSADQSEPSMDEPEPASSSAESTSDNNTDDYGEWDDLDYLD